MMWPYDGGGWGWFWMAGMMVVFWGAVIFLIVWAITSLTARRAPGNEAIDTLRKRLASGEITKDEFETTRRLIES